MISVRQCAVNLTNELAKEFKGSYPAGDTAYPIILDPRVVERHMRALVGEILNTMPVAIEVRKSKLQRPSEGDVVYVQGVPMRAIEEAIHEYGPEVIEP